MLSLVQDLWLSNSMFLATFCLFKTKVMCKIFISVDIFILKCRIDNKKCSKLCF
jgi:hypothetical protein